MPKNHTKIKNCLNHIILVMYFEVLYYRKVEMLYSVSYNKYKICYLCNNQNGSWVIIKFVVLVYIRIFYHYIIWRVYGRIYI